MPAYCAILIKIEARKAGKLRYCRHNKSHEIRKGMMVLEVSSAQFDKRGYCASCALKIIERAKQDLVTLESQFSEPS